MNQQERTRHYGYRLGSLIEEANRYCPVPRQFKTGLPGFYSDLLGVDGLGSGYHHIYWPRHLRLLVGWFMFSAVTGPNRRNSDAVLSREVAHMIADHTGGWVVVSEGQVSWMETPTPAVFDRAAVAIPVPDWSEEHQD